MERRPAHHIGLNLGRTAECPQVWLGIEMTDTDPNTPDLPSHPYRSSAVSGRKTIRFTFAPDTAARASIAQVLGLIDLPEFQLKGELQPMGRIDVALRADLTALVIQPCSISLAPVTSRLNDRVERNYRHDFEDPKGDEVEMLGDDAEALPEVIDVAAVAIEALALALPLYPRAKGVDLGALVATPPGAQPLTDEALKPFAGLAGLADLMKKPAPPSE